jgi:sensor histidine kinase YesM
VLLFVLDFVADAIVAVGTRQRTWYETPWPSASDVLGTGLAYALWIPFTACILAILRVLPLSWRTSPLHLVLAAVTLVAHSTTYLFLDGLSSTGRLGLELDQISTLSARVSGFGLTVYAATAALTVARASQQRLREKALAAAHLEAALARSELTSLREQLHPHFVFNALNTIASLIQDDGRQAERMVVHLSRFLRLVLETRNELEVPLSEELALTDEYLELQRMRFGDRLRVEVSVDPQALSVPVPRLFLQPLVENAVHHGVARRAEGGWISIRARISPDALHVTVADDGLGLAPAPAGPVGGTTPGLGLANVRDRLLRLYGADAALRLEPRAEGGTAARVTIPLPDQARP